MISKEDIKQARKEYLSLPDSEWRKDYFDDATGGFVATHVLKTKDNVKRKGIAKEVIACWWLAKIGRHVLRLPENILDKIDQIFINGKSYRELLKFKPHSSTPRGYPDVFFDNQTWDFKTSTFLKEDTLRQRIKDGRKADNLIFIIDKDEDAAMALKAIRSEYGMRRKDGSWKDLPDVYCLKEKFLSNLWHK